MPTQRKRIGFLPSAEVQKIIDQLCKNNKLSQSKVTGILVEEALCSRGVLINSKNKKNYEFSSNIDNSALITNDIFDNKEHKKCEDLNLDEKYVEDEVQMINDYIEFKFFKNIMNKNKKIN
ncbi:hypothetical protein P9515_09421 [Prochlorococcus marinus str. MIT 9515]|uniref:Uncharacterized protein n=1 Tax=Prochlorococcus marinus (strain MIT 9515) TaxID=167542 RepID=A2BWI8_PROM5|nr:hypothetical protein P9515_09421 [Prochlorococcus marinus str. MIT 9515]